MRSESGERTKRYVLRLFVAGDAPNSRIARQNLKRLGERVGEAEIVIEIVDVLVDPRAAIEHGVYLTPALQIIEPGPSRFVYGNLSDEDALDSTLV